MGGVQNQECVSAKFFMQVIAAGQQYAVFPRDHKQNKLILSQQQLSSGFREIRFFNFGSCHKWSV